MVAPIEACTSGSSLGLYVLFNHEMCIRDRYLDFPEKSNYLDFWNYLLSFYTERCKGYEHTSSGGIYSWNNKDIEITISNFSGMIVVHFENPNQFKI